MLMVYSKLEQLPQSFHIGYRVHLAYNVKGMRIYCASHKSILLLEGDKTTVWSQKTVFLLLLIHVQLCILTALSVPFSSEIRFLFSEHKRSPLTQRSSLNISLIYNPETCQNTVFVTL